MARPVAYGTRVKALHGWEAQDDTQLSFPAEAIIMVSRVADTGWWEGYYGTHMGWFPSNYTETTEENIDPGTIAFYEAHVAGLTSQAAQAGESMSPLAQQLQHAVASRSGSPPKDRGAAATPAGTAASNDTDPSPPQTALQAEIQRKKEALAAKEAEKAAKAKEMEKVLAEQRAAEDKEMVEAANRRKAEQAAASAGGDAGAGAGAGGDGAVSSSKGGARPVSPILDKAAQEREAKRKAESDRIRTQAQTAEDERNAEAARKTHERAKKEREMLESKTKETGLKGEKTYVTRGGEKLKFTKGGKVWIPDDVEGWVVAIVVNWTASDLLVRTAYEDFEETAVNCVPYVEFTSTGKAASYDSIDDLVLLAHAHAAPLLACLRARFDGDRMYTYIGSQVLVSVNPYQQLESNNAATRRAYIGKEQGELPPHIFALTDIAFRSLVLEGTSQSIIVSGESGAGKTEACKLIMQFMGEACAQRNATRGDAALVERLMEQIIQSNPVLEAFGNAKTTRNNNSSRFGKFLQIQFTSDGIPCGARCVQYLLEKSRLVSQNAEERNFHIFFQLTAGAGADERAKLGLKKAHGFSYLNSTGCITVDGVDDAAELMNTRSAMRVLGISEANVNAVFEVLAGILHLGNVTFQPPIDETMPCKLLGDASRSLQFAAAFLGIDTNTILRSLSMRKIVTPTEDFMKPNDDKQCHDVRDTLAKAIYSQLFDWLFNELNTLIAAKEGLVNAFVGILDICGFEIFKNNSFEQLCINYCNERLAKAFVDVVFKLEMEEYQGEGIDWEPVAYHDNSQCVEMIDGGSNSIIALLNEESSFPKSTERTLAEKIVSQLKDHKHFEMPHPGSVRHGFTVRHYAGPVTYDTSNFLEKNRDVFPVDLQDAVKMSENAFMRKLFEGENSPASAPTIGGNKSAAAKLASRSVASKFKVQLQSLVTDLAETCPFYVRCIKPNERKAKRVFEGAKVEVQIQCNNIIETIRLRQLGWAYRKPFEVFYSRFWICWDKGLHEGAHPKAVMAGGNPKKGIPATLKEAVIEVARSQRLRNDSMVQEYSLGTTKVFIRSAKSVLQLEQRRHTRITAMAGKLQGCSRMVAYFAHYNQVRAAGALLVEYGRAAAQRSTYANSRAIAVLLGNWIRSAPYRCRYAGVVVGAQSASWAAYGLGLRFFFLERRAAARQASCSIKRVAFVRLRAAVQRCQALARQQVYRFRFLHFALAIPVVQNIARRAPYRNEYLTAVSSARVLQRVARASDRARSYNGLSEGVKSLVNALKCLPDRSKFTAKSRASRSVQSLARMRSQRLSYVQGRSTKSGWLYSQVTGTQRYEQLWFALQAGTLSVYANDRSRKVISSVKVGADAEIVGNASDSNAFSFRIRSEDKVLTLASKTNRERSAWVASLLFSGHHDYMTRRMRKTAVREEYKRQAAVRMDVIRKASVATSAPASRAEKVIVPPLTAPVAAQSGNIGEQSTRRVTIAERLASVPEPARRIPAVSPAKGNTGTGTGNYSNNFGGYSSASARAAQALLSSPKLGPSSTSDGNGRGRDGDEGTSQNDGKERQGHRRRDRRMSSRVGMLTVADKRKTFNRALGPSSANGQSERPFHGNGRITATDMTNGSTAGAGGNGSSIGEHGEWSERSMQVEGGGGVRTSGGAGGGVGVGGYDNNASDESWFDDEAIYSSAEDEDIRDLDDRQRAYLGTDGVVVGKRRVDWRPRVKKEFEDKATQYEAPPSAPRRPQDALAESIRQLLPTQVADWSPGAVQYVPTSANAAAGGAGGDWMPAPPGGVLGSPVGALGGGGASLTQSLGVDGGLAASSQLGAMRGDAALSRSPVAAVPSRRLRILFLVQDRRIEELLEWVGRRRDVLNHHYLTSVGTYVSARIGRAVDTKEVYVIERLADAHQVLEGRQADVFIFFWDPAQPLWQLHADMLSLALSTNVLVAFNTVTADTLLQVAAPPKPVPVDHPKLHGTAASPTIGPRAVFVDPEEAHATTKYKRTRAMLRNNAVIIMQALARGWLTRRHTRFASC